jgi:hypothetical protein
MGTMKHQFILGLFLLGACSSTNVDTKKELDPVQMPDGFCQKWGEAACNATVVTNCQAASAAACVAKQKQFCESLLLSKSASGPFVLAKANTCLDAVKTAYATASLSAAGKDTVIQLGYPCDTLETEATDAGSDSGCSAPVCKTGGQTCGGAGEACVPGFYCDGAHCIESPAAGAACCVGYTSCALTITCQVADRCTGVEGSQTCVARNAVRGPCTEDAECAQGLFCSSATNGVCVSTLVLNVNEPVCQNLS